MSTSTGKVIAKAREFLAGVPEGIRYAQLHRQIAIAFPNIPPYGTWVLYTGPRIAA